MTPTPPLSPSEIPAGGAAAEKLVIHNIARSSLDSLKQTIAPAIIPTLTIAGMAYLTFAGIYMILMGKKPPPFSKEK